MYYLMVHEITALVLINELSAIVGAGSLDLMSCLFLDVFDEVDYDIYGSILVLRKMYGYPLAAVVGGYHKVVTSSK